VVDDGTDESLVVRQVSLPDDRRLVVRRATADDVERLIGFYRSLPLEDRYFRFFTGGMPPRRHFERVVDPANNGVALVVEVRDGDMDELIGDACYLPKDDGAGELAVTVHPEWRGWLGPYLLDALLELAAANGIDTLEAEILVRNRPMLALVRARGCVTIGDDDLSRVRVALGTSSRVPSWPARDERPRVLVEAANPRWRLGITRTGPGINVRVCPGPPAGSPQRCPMLAGKPCPLAADADAIVVAGSIDDALAHQLLDAHVREDERAPLFVEAEELGATDGDRPIQALPRTLPDIEAAARILAAIANVRGTEAG
jgi:RimJ/RimL family protein N-acetyltransferase